MEEAGFRREEDSERSKDLAKRLKTTYKKGEKRKLEDDEDLPTGNIVAQFTTPEGENTGAQLDMPVNTTADQLQTIINHLLKNGESRPYSFYIETVEVNNDVAHVIKNQSLNVEKVIKIVYHPQAVFHVRPVTRCSGTLSGHGEAVLHASFSPDGERLATGSGDTTLRIWDVHTETPIHICKEHKHWIQATAWSPNGKWLASASADGDLRIWHGDTGLCAKKLIGHKGDIRSLSWEPMHRDAECRRVASAGKDATVRIWDVPTGRLIISLNGHTQPVNAIVWGGEGLLYSVSSDTFIKVWDPEKGIMVRQMKHAHRVNTITVNTEYVLKTGHYDFANHESPKEITDPKAAHEKSIERYQLVKGSGPERVVTGSDDHTLYMWQPSVSKTHTSRMVGHQQVVNHVKFSPDGRYLASASFDKSVRLWDGVTGNFIAVFRGHVQRVYMVCFSADSRLLLSASADSTCKIWNLQTRKAECDLPGHADEVYAADWSPDGERVATGGKDRQVKIWQH